MRRVLISSACVALATLALGSAQAEEACVPHPSATVHHSSLNGALITHVDTKGFCDPWGAIAASLAIMMRDAQLRQVRTLQLQVRQVQAMQLQLAMQMPTVCDSVKAKQDGWCTFERPPIKTQDRLPRKVPVAEAGLKLEH